MPLASNASSTADSWQHVHGDTVSEGLAKSLENTFIVSPSPCINKSDFKIPGVYNYAKTLVKSPKGMIGGYYYWGSPGNRKRTENSYTGTFSSVVWNSFDDGSASVGFGTPEIYSLAKLAARNRAVNKLLDKIQNSEINLSTTIGEGKETLRMIAAISRSAANPLKGLLKAVGDSRSKRSKKFGSREAVVLVSQAELAWGVGLKPLLSDVENLRKHVVAADNFAVSIAVKSRGTSKDTFVKPWVNDHSWSVEVSDWYQFGCSYRITDPLVFENWRAGLTVRPTLAWELTTLSFVVDYFLQIGNFLAALEASYLNNGITFEHGYETHSAWKLANWQISRADDPDDYGASNGSTDHHLGRVSAKGYRQWVTKSRSRLTGLPTHAFPTVKLPTAASSLLNCAALLGVLLKK